MYMWHIQTEYEHITDLILSEVTYRYTTLIRGLWTVIPSLSRCYKKSKMYIKNSDHQKFKAFLYNDIKLHVLINMYALSP